MVSNKMAWVQDFPLDYTQGQMLIQTRLEKAQDVCHWVLPRMKSPNLAPWKECPLGLVVNFRRVGMTEKNRSVAQDVGFSNCNVKVNYQKAGWWTNPWDNWSTWSNRQRVHQKSGNIQLPCPPGPIQCNDNDWNILQLDPAEQTREKL